LCPPRSAICFFIRTTEDRSICWAIPCVLTARLGRSDSPYLVEIARKISPSQRLNALIEIGLIVTCACDGSNEVHYRLEHYLTDSYHQAIRDSLPLLAETLQCKMEEKDILTLAFCVAALKGHIKLAEVLSNLESCPQCSEIMGWK
jgi:hypothetical protein